MLRMRDILVTCPPTCDSHQIRLFSGREREALIERGRWKDFQACLLGSPADELLQSWLVFHDENASFGAAHG